MTYRYRKRYIDIFESSIIITTRPKNPQGWSSRNCF